MPLDTKAVVEYLRGYVRHSALNAGQAARDIRYVHDYPGATGVRDSVKKRLASLANNLKYTALPPTEIRVGKRTFMEGHHSRAEIDSMRGRARDWFKRGYAPWKHPTPDGVKTAAATGVEKVAYLLAHVEGPSGSGKTTMLQRMKEQHPELVIKDTDEFSEGGSKGWKPRAETARRRKLLDRFLEEHKDEPVVLGGSNIRPNMPGYRVVGALHPKHKVLLDTSPLVSSLRRLRRNWSKPSERVMDVPRNIRRASELRGEAKMRGYSEMGTSQLAAVVARELAKPSAGVEKVARVAGRVKEYRRALQAIVDKLPKHSTGPEEAASIARDKLIRANQGVYGKGTYWGLGEFPTNYGNTTIVKNNVGDIRRVADPERASWGLHRTDVGTPIERKDLMILKEDNPHSAAGRRVATAAREARMRVVSPSAYQAAGSAVINKSYLAEMGSPSGKRDFILSNKKWDRRWKRLTPRTGG